MLVWQKRIGAHREEFWLNRLSAFGDERLAVVKIPSAEKTLRLEIYDLEQEEAESLQKQFGGTIKPLADDAWFKAAPDDQEPLKVRDRLLVVNSEAALGRAREKHPNRELIIIPLGMAFGTGEHATTLTCLRFLADVSRQMSAGWSHLDVGCGTGILSIAAEKLGASQIHGFDLLPDAVRIAEGNAVLNEARIPRFTQMDLADWNPSPGEADVLTANVYGDVLLEYMEKLVKAVRRNGHIILSGILTPYWPEIQAGAHECGLETQQFRSIGKWTTGWMKPAA